MHTIYIVGTLHTSKKSKIKIGCAFDKYPIDSLYYEGIEGVDYKNKSLWLKEPLLMAAFFLYSLIFKIRGSEIKLALSLAEKRNILTYSMDVSFHELLQFFHKWYDYIISIFLLTTFWYAGLSIFLSNIAIFFKIVYVVVYFLAPYVLYLAYFALKTKSLRDKKFATTIRQTISKSPRHIILAVCGRYHVKQIKEAFESKMEVITL